MTALRLIVIALAVWATTIQAQGVDQWGKGLELSAHQRLLDMRDRTQAPLAPFTTDGCSGGLSDVWSLVADTVPSFKETYEQLPPWQDCCVSHDRAYHDARDAQNADEGYAARLVADRALRACVMETGDARKVEFAEIYEATPDQVVNAYDTIARAMYLAVRFGGGPCTGLSWRWGYGYPHCSATAPDDQ
jgi:hypothetical protein